MGKRSLRLKAEKGGEAAVKLEKEERNRLEEEKDEDGEISATSTPVKAGKEVALGLDLSPTRCKGKGARTSPVPVEEDSSRGKKRKGGVKDYVKRVEETDEENNVQGGDTDCIILSSDEEREVKKANPRSGRCATCRQLVGETLKYSGHPQSAKMESRGIQDERLSLYGDGKNQIRFLAFC